MTIEPGPIGRLLRWCWADIRRGDTIDLWLLILAAALFTILGVTGVSSVQTLSSVVLALLAVLALSQVRGRAEIRSQIASWRRGRTDVFDTAFPDTYYEARARAGHSYAFAGMTMQRTLPTIRADLERILRNGGSVRILLPDPENAAIVAMVAVSRQSAASPERVAELIRQAIAELATIGEQAKPEVRVTSVLPRVGLNLIDAEHPSAYVMVQMYQLRPGGEPSPIFTLTPGDKHWLNHFRGEFESLWDEGQSHPQPHPH